MRCIVKSKSVATAALPRLLSIDLADEAILYLYACTMYIVQNSAL